MNTATHILNTPEDNVDETYIRLLKELLNNIEDAISQAVTTGDHLDSAEGELQSLAYQVSESETQLQEARTENEQVIIDLEELHADIESEILKEQNNAVNAN